MAASLTDFTHGLRCQDVHSGLRNVEANSPLLTPLFDTRVVGMAATIAGLIRGRDVVTDAQALSTVAAAQLDVDHLAFNEVIRVLEDAELVQGVRRAGSKITSFTETVPYFDDSYAVLGQVWAQRRPTELEQQMLLLIDGLSTAPVPLDQVEAAFGLDHGDSRKLLQVGERAGLVQILRTIDGDLAYSPFFGFENPRELDILVQQHGSARLAEEFDALRRHQGLPISAEHYPLLVDSVARGLVMAPAVTMPDGTVQPFAALPYSADATLLTARKPVLDRALAVLACLRSAELDGGYSGLTPAGLVNVIGKLLDPNRGVLAPHSSHKRQYDLMWKAGLIVFERDPMPGGSWVQPRFVDTDDNREALSLARDLIIHGEPVQDRVDDSIARGALNAGTSFTAPMQTMHRHRARVSLSPEEFRDVFEAAMGRRRA